MEKDSVYFAGKKNVNIILKNHLPVFKECVVEHLTQKNVKKMDVIVKRKRLIVGMAGVVEYP